MSNLQDRLDEFKEAFESGATPYNAPRERSKRCIAPQPSSFGSTLDRFHDESGYRLPMPARYVIDKEGVIRAADVNADYTVRPEPSETVRRLRMLPWDRHS